MVDNESVLRYLIGITGRSKDAVANELSSAAIYRNASSSARIMVAREVSGYHLHVLELR